MTIALTYDPRFHTFESWASLMTEAYSEQQLQVPNAEMNWQDWGVGMCGIDIFSNQGMPNPYQYDNWQTWAEHTVNVIQGIKNEGNFGQ